MAQKLCVVAGVGPGMGFALAERFALGGYAVALLSRTEAKIVQFAASISERHGVVAKAFAVDLSSPEAIVAVFDDIRQQLGDAEVLVYNAGTWNEMAAMNLSPAEFMHDLSLTVVGALACTQQVAAAMEATGKGSVLFTGGGLALYPQYGRGVASLTAGKSALRGLTHAMAGELADRGIHVATVVIAGTVKPGTAFDPGAIAEKFWALHQQATSGWQTELLFDGKDA